MVYSVIMKTVQNNIAAVVHLVDEPTRQLIETERQFTGGKTAAGVARALIHEAIAIRHARRGISNSPPPPPVPSGPVPQTPFG